MTKKIYPKGFNQKLKLVNEAINRFVDSKDFYGLVSPGELYEFCKKQENARFSEIDAYFFNRWDDLNLKELCDEKNISYRKSKPKKTASQSASKTARKILELSMKAPKGSDFKKIVANDSGQTRDVVSASINRSIGMKNLNYLVDVGFSLNDIPNMNRTDLRQFFNTISENQLTSLDQYLVLLRQRVIKSQPFDDFPEHQGSPKSGWIYLFPSRNDTNIVKCGKSERKSVSSRLDEHVLSELAGEGVWSYIYRSDDIDLHESILISVLNVKGKLLNNTKETFNIGNRSLDRIWKKFLERVPT
ncbi:hypothetical protein RGL49_004636 [Vibrio parahaemolyticus]|nr:hypothetical protein [Vibrio parahaemolyticus]